MSTCDRNHVGVVISIDGRIVSTGYNGAPPGMPHCNHAVGSNPTMGCRESTHAEANAIAFAARNGVSVLGGTVHTTLSPCYACAQLILSAGLVRVVYDRPYRDLAGLELLSAGGLIVMGI
jgi:dCMP deaminase